MKPIRYIATALLVTILAVACWPSFAGSISGGRASFSAPRSAPAPSRSIGVQKASPAPAPKPQQAAAPKPTPAPNPQRSYAAAPTPSLTTPAPVVINQQGGSSGGGFMSSFLGGATGAAVGNALTQPHGTTVVQGASPVAGTATVAANGEPVSYAPAQVAVAQPQRSATAGAADNAMAIVVFLGILAAAGVGGYFLLRAYQERRARKLREEAEKMNQIARELRPISLFVNMQKAYAARDMDTLRNLCSADFLAFVETDLPDTPQPYTLTDVSAHVLETSGLESAVRYRAKDTSNDTTLNEVWNLEYIDGAWRVVGIEQ